MAEAENEPVGETAEQAEEPTRQPKEVVERGPRREEAPTPRKM